ncbi:hypothetical protein O181_014713 [Austropuccinia psidii MF-1]|uniref:Uncharacterized protein n=1 Tax=Austropuccinia psidii MF-1 TaxID=1389203 RepID=A0A9Q3GPA0_9BASI|nr:hypothetical protein [Austropuccinia psidii MF-1]
MEHKNFNLASHWEELGARCKKICHREMSFKELMEIAKCLNPNRKFKLLEKGEAKIRDNLAKSQNIVEQWSQKEHILTTSGSQGVGKPKSPVASHHP